MSAPDLKMLHLCPLLLRTHGCSCTAQVQLHSDILRYLWNHDMACESLKGDGAEAHHMVIDSHRPV